jgi:drug/metabolite transporter (DMT)-like permease
MAAYSGPGLVLVFCLSQAFRDVYFGSIFQNVDFFAVILLAFLASTVIFVAVTLVRVPGQFARMRSQPGAVIGMNLTTALAWSCYFFALTHLEPSIVNTIHSGMGPLVVVALGLFGARIAQHRGVGRGEALSYAGIALSIAGLWWVVLSGHSGLPAQDNATALAALALLMVSGTSITISLLYAKRLNDAGIDSDAVTAVRYLAIIVLAAGVCGWKGGLGGIDSAGDAVKITAISTVLIVLPLFALQVGVARTAPLTAQVIRALGPVFIFALQPFDGRMHYSMPVLACILIYSGAVIAGNVAHGWRDGSRHASRQPKAA